MNAPVPDSMLNRNAFTLVEAMIVVSIIALLATLAIPAFMKPLDQARRDVCIQNLRVLNYAKEMWAFEENKPYDDIPSAGELTPYVKGGTADIHCPDDPDETFATSYDIGTVNDSCRCRIHPDSHQL